MSERGWSAAETWVWERVRANEVADFHRHLGKLDPNVAEGWDDARRLDTAFIRRIFYDRSLRDDIPPEGVRIIGAWFPNGLMLPHARLHQQMWLECCRFGQTVDLNAHTTEGELSFEGSSFTATERDAPALTLDRSRISGPLVLADATVAGGVNLKIADIKGHVVLSGAAVSGKLAMDNLQVGQDLLLASGKQRPATFADVDLMGAEIKGDFILSGSTVAGKLAMNRLEVGQSLLMRGSKDQPATFADVDLTVAYVKGQLVLDGASVSGKLMMDSLRVGQSLFMRGSKDEPTAFADVDLMGADIKGHLFLSGAAVAGKLVMQGLRVGESLSMGGSAELPTRFGDVDLMGADVRGHLVLSGTTVTGALTMTILQVGRNLLMRGSPNWSTTVVKGAVLTQAKVAGGVDLAYARLGALTLNGATIGSGLDLGFVRCEFGGRGGMVWMQNLYVGGYLNLEGATARHFDLFGSKMAGELRLRSLSWPIGASRLILRDAHASVLDEDFATWPAHVKLELDGFTYDRIRGVGGTDETIFTRREWHERRIGGWLDRDITYTPQPYEQLAGVLRRAGESAKAATVLYAGRERERRHERESYLAQRRGRAGSRTPGATGPRFPGWYGWRHTGLTLLKWTIGYGLGLRYFRCLWWIAGLTLLGTAILQADAANIPPANGLVYSFQKLLPPFARIEEFHGVKLGTFARWYFYAHQLVGYVLAGFLAAGLAGLTQKS